MEHQPLFTQLRALLGDAERLHLSIEADADDGLIVLLQPVLRNRPDESIAAPLAEVRAALMTPLRLRASAAELDESFLDLLARYSRDRAVVSADLAVLDQLNDAKSKAGKHRAKAESKAATQSVERAEEISGEAPPPVAPSKSAASSNNLFD